MTFARIPHVALFIVLAVPVLIGVEVNPKPPTTNTPSTVAPAGTTPLWLTDPDCQLVFFAVLEGCYRSGLQNEAVDAIITPTAADRPGVKTCFVFQCDLCHAAYEAFVLYRRRQTFLGDGKLDTFGAGVSTEVIAALRSKEPATRVYAMGKLMRPWIRDRVAGMKLNKDELRSMAHRFLAFRGKGMKLLQEYKGSDPDSYREWNFYGSCQACEATQEIEELIRL